MNFLKIYVTFFGLGLAPKMPGTVGTLGAVVLGYFFLQTHWLWQALIILFVVLTGIITCEMYEKATGEHDSSAMVIDEVAGYLIAIFWLPLTWQSLLIAFVLFRVLDITKPLFIGLADRKISGGLGVMADDILAGMVTGLVMQSLLLHYPAWLGV